MRSVLLFCFVSYLLRWFVARILNIFLPVPPFCLLPVPSSWYDQSTAPPLSRPSTPVPFHLYVSRLDDQSIAYGSSLLLSPCPWMAVLVQRGTEHPTISTSHFVSFVASTNLCPKPPSVRFPLIESHTLGVLGSCWCDHWPSSINRTYTYKYYVFRMAT